MSERFFQYPLSDDYVWGMDQDPDVEESHSKPVKPKSRLTDQEYETMKKMSQRQAEEMKALLWKRRREEITVAEHRRLFLALVERHEAENKAFWDEVKAAKETR